MALLTRTPERETCQLCHKAPPAWLVLDDKPHVYVQLETGEARRQCDGYFVCGTCRSQIERYNKSKHPRKVRFVRWEAAHGRDA